MPARYEIQVKSDAGDLARWSVYVYAEVNLWHGREASHDLESEASAFNKGVALAQDLRGQALILGVL